MNTRRASFSPVLNRVSRAQFSPLIPRAARPAPVITVAPVPYSAREFAERSFLNRWERPGLLDRVPPVLTRYRE